MVYAQRCGPRAVEVGAKRPGTTKSFDDLLESAGGIVVRRENLSKVWKLRVLAENDMFIGGTKHGVSKKRRRGAMLPQMHCAELSFA